MGASVAALPRGRHADVRALLKVAAAGAAAGVAGLAYAAGIEVRNFTLREVEIPCLPPGARPIRVLHVSDLHLTPSQGRKRGWLRSLAELEPDLVVNTGDNLAHLDAVPPLVDGFGPLLDVPGVFVFGSNDYFAPTLRNPLWYLMPDDGGRNTHTPQASVARTCAPRSTTHGWLDLTNTSGRLEVSGRGWRSSASTTRTCGYDDLAAVAGPAPADADLRIGVAHAPYLRVLDQFADDGYDVTFAGHTHGGQLCLPFKGAIVTNCDLDTARARGCTGTRPTRDPGTRDRPGCTSPPGAGTSPYAPVRLLLPPRGDPADAARRSG